MSAVQKLTAESSGVYRAPDDAARLRERSEMSGLVWIDAHIGGVRDKHSLMRVLAEALGFPSDFGNNWDALADALQDMSWQPAAGYVLFLHGARPARRALGEGWLTLLEVLALSAAYWKSRGRPFIALLDAGEELPLWR